MAIRNKADIWAQIAVEMAISWREAEKMHWYLGQAQMRKRGSDDSFRTTCIILTSRQVVDTEMQARRQQQDQQRQQLQEQGVRQPRLGWSGDEETVLFACKRARMSWKSISALLPGRTAHSCRDYYDRQRKLGLEWPPERKNRFCKLYESLKSSMWAKIGEELKVGWKVAEDMHWNIGAKEMAERAGVPLSSQATVEFAPSQARNAEAHQHRDQEHDLVQQSSFHPHPHPPPPPPHHPSLSLSQTQLSPMTHEGQPGSSVTLPSFAEITAGIEMLWRPPHRDI
ncbi:hypothetical protein E4U39_005875 [Claviceps sp. Clav50 group G5]|nr:hypothetical protein E4U39_005875 [Claviceps sp. Clav50 group G5]